MELLKIRTEQFEGPLDLLLFLIQKNEMDVSNISIHVITDQYVQYIEMMRELNFDLASDFLVMASTLLFLKSKRLLPSDIVEQNNSENPQEITSEAELIRRLMEYKKFQEISQKLSDSPMLDRDIFARPNVLPPEKQTVWKELDLTGLTLAFQDVLRRSRSRSKVIIREPTSIPEKIMQLAQILKANEMTEFASLLSPEPDRTEIIVTFIALLELARLKKLRILQNETYGSIYLSLSEAIDALDPTMMTGFEYNTKKIEEMVL